MSQIRGRVRLLRVVHAQRHANLWGGPQPLLALGVVHAQGSHRARTAHCMRVHSSHGAACPLHACALLTTCRALCVVQVRLLHPLLLHLYQTFLEFPNLLPFL